MLRVRQADLKHVHFLLTELEAELRAHEAADEAAQALAQLDAREAAGEPLVEVCGRTLRASLSLRVAQSPVTAGLRKLQDMRDAIDGRLPPQTAPAQDPSHSVIDLAQRRTAIQAQPEASRGEGMWRLGHAVAVSLVLAALTLTGLLQHPVLGRLQIIDVAAYVPYIAYPTERLIAIDGF